MRTLPILLCWLIYATACVSRADTAPVPLSDFTAPGGYSIHLTNVGQASPTDYTVVGTVTNTGKSRITARITVQYLSQTGLPVSQQDFFVTNLAAGKSQQFHVKCPNYWVTYAMTIHSGEREGSTAAAPLENIAPTSAPLSNTPVVEVQPLNIDSGNLYSNTAEPAPPAADSNTTAPSGDEPHASGYSTPGSIGTSSSDAQPEVDPNAALPISQWLGHKLVFLLEYKMLQHFGYQGVWRGQNHDDDLSVNSIPYDELAGKVATVISVEPDGGDCYVTVRTTDGTYYSTRSVGGFIDHVALTDDIDRARSLYVNKILWLIGSGLETYDASKDTGSTDTSTFLGWVNTKKYAPVTVTAITTGQGSAPVRFICKTADGQVGYIDLAMSMTNLGMSYFDYQFSNAFLTSDPRKDHPWSPAIWSEIEDGTVAIGMPADAARLSWGEPNSINTDIYNDGPCEQWVYYTKYLYVQNDKVTAIQTGPGQ
jgi:hypothetical protein